MSRNSTLSHQHLIEQRLSEVIPEVEGPHLPLFKAARYSLLLPAKRFRPLLVLSVLEDFGCPLEFGIDPACALEMVHTYSLIHDDLPCMDNDELRRGKPTLHKAYSEAQAILAGDYLLTYAFEILANAPHLSPGKKLELINLLSNRSGGDGMIGGQMIDILNEGKSINPETLDLMFEKKTASLLGSALEFGALIADVTRADRNHLKRAGFSLGIAYQYIDDLLDQTGIESEMGKPIGSDRKRGKANALSLLSKPKTREKAKAHFEEAVAKLKQLSQPAPLTTSLFEKCFHRSK